MKGSIKIIYGNLVLQAHKVEDDELAIQHKYFSSIEPIITNQNKYIFKILETQWRKMTSSLRRIKTNFNIMLTIKITK